MSRATRKAYNMGKRDGEHLGYIKGYSDGLIDGNPFNSIIKAINSIIESVKELTPEEIERLKADINDDEDPDDEETPAVDHQGAQDPEPGQMTFDDILLRGVRQ